MHELEFLKDYYKTNIIYQLDYDGFLVESKDRLLFVKTSGGISTPLRVSVEKLIHHSGSRYFN